MGPARVCGPEWAYVPVRSPRGSQHHVASMHALAREPVRTVERPRVGDDAVVEEGFLV